MNKVWDFLADKKYIIMAILGVLILAMTFKSQVVVVKYGDNYAMRLEHTVFGYCIRASASLKETEPAVQNEIYIGNSFNVAAQKAVKQMSLLSDSEQTVEMMVSGFPKNSQKLEKQIQSHLESLGYNVEIIDVSLTEAITPKNN